MIYLEIIGLAFATGGALYGIWTRTPRNNTVATISTVITALGLITATGLAIWKSIDARKNATIANEKRQAELQAVLGNAELSDIEIVWTFNNVPDNVLAIFDVGDMIVDTNLLRDDERSRLPAEIRAIATHAWHLESTVAPLLHAIDTGEFDEKTFYKGESLDEALHRWKENQAEWSDNIGTNIHYVGPTPELLFPLNLKSNAALSLGKIWDDKASETAHFVWQEDDPSLYNETNFAFHVKAEKLQNGFTLMWSYPDASLKRAAERATGTKLVSGLPSEFSFVIVRKRLRNGEYLEALAGHNQSDSSDELPKTPKWDVRSTMDVYVNGLLNPHYTYSVTKVGTFEKSRDQGAYDAPEFQYNYTLFNCKLQSM